MTTSAEFEAPPSQKETGHPKGLYVLFGAEMWERFSYYGMRALLVLYLTNRLGYVRKDALALYAVYTGLVYLTPILGGFLADKFLGQRKAILIGGIVMAMGHFAMAFPPLLELALGLLILGNGFFKPNISTMVGNLYPQGDPRRDGAYTIFYMGINLGAFFSPIVCGILGERIGWHYGFGAAGVGMVFGLISFLSFQRLLVGGFPPGREEELGDAARLTVMDWVHVVLISLACLGFAYGGIETWPTVRPFKAYLFYALGALAGLGVLNVGRHLIFARDKIESEEWQRVTAILIVGVFSVVFWMAFEQAGGTLTLFADKNTDRSALGPEIPASLFQSINPLLIFILAPVFSILWAKLDQSRFKLTSTAKMGLGLVLLGLGCVVMNRAEVLSVSAKVGPQWLASVYFLFTLGEICLSPIGLSMVNKLAPARMASLMMAIWFLCTAVANYLAGILEHELSHTGINLWHFLIATSIIPGLLLLALTVPLKKMGHGRL